MESHDAIHNAEVDLVDVGGLDPSQIALAPAKSWAVGFVVFWIALAVLGFVSRGVSLTTVFLALVAAALAGKWTARETGGDHRIPDLAMTVYAELGSCRRRYQARRGH